MPGFRKVAEEEVRRGSLIQVAVGTFESPAGERFERDIVHHPGAVVVVPLLGDGSVVMVRQFRAAIAMDLLEVPAGKRDVEGEPPETTARRELAEEVGFRAGRLELLARFYNSPGFSDEFSYLFLARDLEPIDTDLQGIEEQYMAVEHVALADVAVMVQSAEICDGKTIIGLSLTRELLAREASA